ncbi:MAG: glycosyltransferase family 39 protein [Gammaproteobacteria bacterium]|nr:glycosyltransferase family 39 protein [Gammaproteobacteria bacterium]
MLTGIALRFDQYWEQILIDDEWHAVHQLLRSTPERIATSFGHADYSIPLTLLYWMEARYFGLSEFLMRWPMMLFGLATLIGFSVYAYQQFGRCTALLFSVLLALSPLLIIYSRTARPYAITLFLVYCSLWLFYKVVNHPQNKFAIKILMYLVVYWLSVSLAIWMHLVVALFVAAPFLVELTRLLFRRGDHCRYKLISMFWLAVPGLLLTLLLVLPPLLSNLQDLTVKSGAHFPGLDTVVGAIYLWYGSYSGLVVLMCCVLTVIGLRQLMRRSRMPICILIGFILTLLLILATQPAWVNHPLTLARYLLPILPLLLLSTAAGLSMLLKYLNTITRDYGQVIQSLIVLTLVTGFIMTSPVSALIHQPNSNTLHPFYTFEFRPEKNLIELALRERTYSEFWKHIQNQPLDVKVTVLPWYFESHFWDAPVWEEISGHYVVPGFLTGLCVQERAGEVPDNERFDFRNVSYPGQRGDLQRLGIHYIVYQKPARLKISRPYTDIRHCGQVLRKHFGEPFFEDQMIVVFQPEPGHKADTIRKEFEN